MVSSEAKNGFNCVSCGTFHRDEASCGCRSPTPESPRKGEGRGLGNPQVWGELCYEGSASQTHGRPTSSAFCAASCACSHAAGSVSVTPRATTSRPSLIPATLFAVWHNAEFNVFHQLVPRNDYQGGTRTLCTVPHSEHMNARSPGSRPRGEMSAT